MEKHAGDTQTVVLTLTRAWAGRTTPEAEGAASPGGRGRRRGLPLEASYSEELGRRCAARRGGA